MGSLVSSKDGSADKGRVSDRVDLCGGLVQVVAAVDTENLQGAVVSFQSLFWVPCLL